MKYKTKNFIIAGIVCLVVGLALVFSGFTAVGFDIYSLSSEGEFSQREVSFDNAKSLYVDSAFQNIEIISSKDEQLRVTCAETKSRKYSVNIQDGTVSVVLNDRREWSDYIFNIQPKTTLKIALPASFAGIIDVNARFADISADSVNCSQLLLTSTHSRISLNDVTSSGNAFISATHDSISFSRLNAQSIKLQCEYADISGSLVGTLGDYAVTSRCSFGDSNLPEQSSGKRPLTVTARGDINIWFEQ